MATDGKPWIAEIERFYSQRSQKTTEFTYNRIFPGSYMYLVNDSSRSVRFLADRVDDATAYRRAAAFGLRRVSAVPSLLRHVPGVDRCSVSVVPKNAFDVAILGSRTKLLSWKKETATTLSNGYPEFVRKEIEIRRKLPDSVQVPETVETNVEFPYLVEQLIDGKSLGTPAEDWPFYKQAFMQLQTAYKHFPSDRVATDDVLSEVRAGLGEQDLLEDETIQQAMQTVTQLKLPETLSRGFAHGDVFGGNILRDDDRILIIDWAESSFERFQFGDFVHSLLKQFGITGNSDILTDAFHNRGVGGTMLEAYGHDLGETVWGSTRAFPGCVLLYPLIALANERYNRTYTETTFYSAIVAVLRSKE